jgi:hypothetical protein
MLQKSQGLDNKFHTFKDTTFKPKTIYTYLLSLVGMAECKFQDLSGVSLLQMPTPGLSRPPVSSRANTDFHAGILRSLSCKGYVHRHCPLA